MKETGRIEYPRVANRSVAMRSSIRELLQARDDRVYRAGFRARAGDHSGLVLAGVVSSPQNRGWRECVNAIPIAT